MTSTGKPDTDYVVVDCCDHISQPLTEDAALYLAGTHDALHHRGRPIAEIRAADADDEDGWS